MDFSLSETELMLQSSTERFVRERHSFETRKRLLQSSQERAALWRGLAQLGLLGLGIDAEFGGSGGDFQHIALVMEEFGKGLVCEPYLQTVILGAWLISAAGNAQQKAVLLSGVAEGRVKLALAHSEPGARYDLASVKTTAERNGTKYRLRGRKTGVLGGDEAMLIVSARCEEAHGVSLFLVRPETPGVSIRSRTTFDDRSIAETDFDGVEIEPTAFLGAEGAALPFVEHAIDRAIAALCWDAVGAMTALNAMTLDYIKTRTQFGRPIGKFQVLQHRMVDMTIAAERARSMAILRLRALTTLTPRRAAEISPRQRSR